MRFFIEIIYKNKSESKHYFDLDATSAKEAGEGIRTELRSGKFVQIFPGFILNSEEVVTINVKKEL